MTAGPSIDCPPVVDPTPRTVVGIPAAAGMAGSLGLAVDPAVESLRRRYARGHAVDRTGQSGGTTAQSL